MCPLKSGIQSMGFQRVGHNLFGYLIRASLEAQPVKNMPATWETWDRSLDWEDPLEKRKAFSSILAWRIL